MKKVLLTGANGFIGRHTLAGLLERDYEVHAVSSKDLCNGVPSIHWHKVDLLEPNQISGLISQVQPTHLLHFAWVTEPGKYWTSLENIKWVQASLDLVQEFARRGGQRAVMAGTCAEYDWRHSYCTEGKTPLVPTQLYGVCKHALQIILHGFAEKAGIRAAWGRIFFLFGPYEKRERLIPSVINSLLKREPIHCSHWKETRDFLFVQDVANAFVALLESKVTGPVNVSSGQGIQIKEIVKKAASQIGGIERVQWGSIEVPSMETPDLVGDNRRLCKEVGWSPKYDLERGLGMTIEWWKERLDKSAENMTSSFPRGIKASG